MLDSVMWTEQTVTHSVCADTLHNVKLKHNSGNLKKPCQQRVDCTEVDMDVQCSKSKSNISKGFAGEQMCRRKSQVVEGVREVGSSDPKVESTAKSME